VTRRHAAVSDFPLFQVVQGENELPLWARFQEFMFDVFAACTGGTRELWRAQQPSFDHTGNVSIQATSTSVSRLVNAIRRAPRRGLTKNPLKEMGYRSFRYVAVYPEILLAVHNSQDAQQLSAGQADVGVNMSLPNTLALMIANYHEPTLAADHASIAANTAEVLCNLIAIRTYNFSASQAMSIPTFRRPPTT